MCLRSTAAGMLEAEQQFRKIIGCADLAKLALAVERDLTASRSSDHSHDRRAGHYARHRLTINRGPSPRSSTAPGASSEKATAMISLRGVVAAGVQRRALCSDLHQWLGSAECRSGDRRPVAG